MKKKKVNVCEPQATVTNKSPAIPTDKLSTIAVGKSIPSDVVVDKPSTIAVGKPPIVAINNHNKRNKRQARIKDNAEFKEKMRLKKLAFQQKIPGCTNLLGLPIEKLEFESISTDSCYDFKRCTFNNHNEI